MCKRKSPQKSKSNMGCVRETPQMREASTGCVRETPPRKMNPPWDV